MYPECPFDNTTTTGLYLCQLWSYLMDHDGTDYLSNISKVCKLPEILKKQDRKVL